MVGAGHKIRYSCSQWIRFNIRSIFYSLKQSNSYLYSRTCLNQFAFKAWEIHDLELLIIYKHGFMKHILCLAILGLALSCGGTKIDQTVELNRGTVINNSQDAGTALPFSDGERVGEIIGYLASDDLQGREAGSEGINKAAAYIEGIF